MRLSAGRRSATTVTALVALATASFAACARMEPPPGGPPDKAPPHLLTVIPETGAVLPKFGGEVEFRFDEVLAEGGAPSQGTGTGDLERLIILSPSTRVPKVSWRRSRITVKPVEGWQPNRIYRIQLLPGISDLRRNRSDTNVVVTFSTGAPPPQTTLTGTVIDWMTQRPAANALIVAVLAPDSLPYRTITDSNGTFKFGPLPQGSYVVYGVIDENHDNRQSPREAYDSVKTGPSKADIGELWTFVHDSAPPRIQGVTVDDSLSAIVAFSQMLDPVHPFDTSAVRLRRLPDSASVAIRSLLPKPVDDSVSRAAAPPDTAKADTLPRPPKPKPGPVQPAPSTSRPPLFDRLVLRVPEPWKPGARYVIDIKDVRNVTGTVGTVHTVITVPEPKPALPDSLRKLHPDSLKKLHPDSLKPPADTIHP